MDAKLKLVRSLLEKRRAREREGKFVVEGPHLVEEASSAVKYVLYHSHLPIVKKLEAQGIPCYRISKERFAELSEVATPQGVLAVVKQSEHQLSDLLNTKAPLLLFCIEVQDPGNLGTIIRTADAAGAAGVILSRGTVDLYNSKVVRASMGSIFHLPIVRVKELTETIDKLKKKKIRIVAADHQAKKDYYQADLSGPAAILVGNEGAGLPEELWDLADEIVRIPMPGRAESLNVGVASAIILYEALRQRQHGRKN